MVLGFWEKGAKWFIFFFLIINQNCGDHPLGQSSDRERDGIIDLTSIDFTSRGLFELNSGWRYFPDQLILKTAGTNSSPVEPREGCSFFILPSGLEKSKVTNTQNSKISPITNQPSLECGNHILQESVPLVIEGALKNKFVNSYHTWELEVDDEGSPRSRFGSAVYTIDIHLKPGKYGVFEENWALSSSGRLWIYQSGKLELLQNIGYPSDSRESTRPMWSGISRTFKAETEDIKLILEVANYHHRVGTLGYSLNLGNQDYITKKFTAYFQMEMAVFGLILMVGSYNFILFLLRHNQKAALWFSLFCFSVAVRILLVSRFFQFHFPDEDWFGLLLRLEYLSFSASPIFMVYYLAHLLKNQVNKTLQNIVVIYCGIITLLVLFTPTEFFSNYLILAILCVLFVILFGLYALMSHINSPDNELRVLARSILAVFFVFSCMAIHDIFMSFGIIQSYDLTGLGLGVFTFGQGIVIAINNSMAWSKSEDLSIQLIAANESLDRKVRERTQSLEDALSNRQRDLALAKKIQTSILPTSNWGKEFLDIQTFFLPLDEVGGDYYDIHMIDEDIYRIFISDATGHGVQAGLITMLIKSEYESLKNTPDQPNNILEELNSRFIIKYKNINTYYTCALCDLHLRKDRLYFASAGHPEQFIVSNSILTKLHRTGRMIGISPDSKYSLQELPFEKGDQLFLFTDGLYEQFDSYHKEFGIEQLESIVKDLFQGHNPNLSQIMKELESWIGTNKMNDDVCYVYCKRV